MPHTFLRQMKINHEKISSIASLLQALTPYTKALISHPIYESICQFSDIKQFMEHHIWVVWGDMALLKTTQSRLTGFRSPWVPVQDPETRRIINEIVLDEESDLTYLGCFSHFEMYHEAMRIADVNRNAIDQFISTLKQGDNFEAAIHEAQKLDMPKAANFFANQVMTYTAPKVSTPRLVGAFSCNRLDLIPDLFRSLVLEVTSGDKPLDLFIAYLDRHMKLDADQEYPKAMRLLESICRHNDAYWQEAFEGARDALQNRIDFWDALTRDMIFSH